MRRPAGYQPELVCQIPWHQHSDGTGPLVPERVTALALNSAYGVLAVGTSAGVALVDIVTGCLVYSWSNQELYAREAVKFGVSGEKSPKGQRAAAEEVGLFLY